jgi:hypothetical protein
MDCINAKPEKIPEDVYKALYNLRKDGNFQFLVQWLRNCAKAETEAWPFIPQEPDKGWSQGRMQALSAILAANDKAEGMLTLFQQIASRKEPPRGGR